MHVAYHKQKDIVGYLFIETIPSPDHVRSLSSPPLTFVTSLLLERTCDVGTGVWKARGGEIEMMEVVIGGAANKGVWFVPQDGCLAAI